MNMKKIFAATLVGAMALGSALSVSAATLPDVTVDSFWGAHSQGVEVTSAGVTIKFKATSTGGANNWETPVYVLYTSADGKVGAAGDAGYTEYWVQRSDNYGWIGAANTEDVSKLPEGYTYTAANLAEDFDWAAWLNANKAGVDVTVTAKLDGDKAVASITNNGVTSQISAKVDTSQKVYIALTGEKCTMTNIVTDGGDTAANSESTASETTSSESAASETTSSEAASSEAATSEAASGNETATKTSDAAPFVLMSVALAACGVIVVASKKRFVK